MNVVLAYGIESAPAARGHVVVIDVLRAFTCAAFALGRGAESIVLVSTTDEAFAVKRARPDVLLMGEVGGRIIPGFDFGHVVASGSEASARGGVAERSATVPPSPGHAREGHSPHELQLSGDRLRRRTLVQRTGSGTQGVVAATNADAVYLGSLPVASATCRHLKAIGAETVTLLAMGSPGGHDGPEDLACRAFMADVLAGREPDRERAIREVRESIGGRQALDPSIDWTVPGDLDCATDIDRFDFAMPVTRESGLLVARRLDLPPPKRDGRWPFDVAEIVARRTLGELPSAEIPAAAERLIAAGFVTDELCALVGLADAGGSLEQERFERSLDSLGLVLDETTAVVVRSLGWARGIRDGTVPPQDGAYEIGRYWRRRPLPRKYEDDWIEFYGLSCESDFAPASAERDARVGSRIRDHARQFIGRYGP